MTLADLKIGQDALIRTVGGSGALRRHLLDMGLTPGTEVTLRKVAPMGDPVRSRSKAFTPATVQPPRSSGMRRYPIRAAGNFTMRPATTSTKRGTLSPKANR